MLSVGSRTAITSSAKSCYYKINPVTDRPSSSGGEGLKESKPIACSILSKSALALEFPVSLKHCKSFCHARKKQTPSLHQCTQSKLVILN